jgi:hypothetical protein
MSIALMTLAWKSDVQSGQKMVLLALCDNANDQGECYPSISMVAKKCSMSERSVFSHIAELEKSGSIRRENRTGRSTIYHLDPCKFCTPANSAPLQPLHPTPATVAPIPLQILHPTPANSAPITINEPSIEPKKKREPAAQAFFLPDWINKKHWDAWHSCKKRKWASEAQKQLAVEKLDGWRLEGADHAAALENAAVGGWAGIFKPDEKTPGRGFVASTHKYAGAAKAIWGNDESRTINA